MTIEKDDLNYMSALGLNREPFSADPELSFLYEYQSFAQRLVMLGSLVQGRETIILVIGEQGAGKTTLLKRYLTSSTAGWKTSRIRIHPLAEKIQPELFKELDSYPAYVLKESSHPIVIIDDAHALSEQQLQFLLQNAMSGDSSQKVKRFVLFGEPGLHETVLELAGSLPHEVAISKIFLPPLTREETAAYLNYRLAVAGYVGKSVFPTSAVKQIQRSSQGLPGRINELAETWLKNKYSGDWQRFGFLQRIMDQPRTLGWAAAGCALVAIVFAGLYYYLAVSESQPKRQGYQATIIRKKITSASHLGQMPSDDLKTKALTKKTQDSLLSESVEEKELQPDIASEAQKIVISQKPSPPPAMLSLAESQSKVEPTLEQKDIKEISTQEPGPEEKEIETGKIHREKWLLTQNSAYYTIQILGVRNEKRLLNFVEENIPSRQQEIAYYQTSYKGKDWYPLLYGIYTTKAEATTAMKELPSTVQKASPWIRQMSSVQRAIQRQSTKKQKPGN